MSIGGGGRLREGGLATGGTEVAAAEGALCPGGGLAPTGGGGCDEDGPGEMAVAEASGCAGGPLARAGRGAAGVGRAGGMLGVNGAAGASAGAPAGPSAPIGNVRLSGPAGTPGRLGGCAATATDACAGATVRAAGVGRGNGAAGVRPTGAGDVPCRMLVRSALATGAALAGGGDWVIIVAAGL